MSVCKRGQGSLSPCPGPSGQEGPRPSMAATWRLAWLAVQSSWWAAKVPAKAATPVSCTAGSHRRPRSSCADALHRCAGQGGRVYSARPAGKVPLLMCLPGAAAPHLLTGRAAIKGQLAPRSPRPPLEHVMPHPRHSGHQPFWTGAVPHVRVQCHHPQNCC